MVSISRTSQPKLAEPTKTIVDNVEIDKLNNSLKSVRQHSISTFDMALNEICNLNKRIDELEKKKTTDKENVKNIALIKELEQRIKHLEQMMAEFTKRINDVLEYTNQSLSRNETEFNDKLKNVLDEQDKVSTKIKEIIETPKKQIPAKIEIKAPASRTFVKKVPSTF